MAERRMFHTSVVESDAFLDLPLAAQALYLHICMHADDDGFVNGPKQITRMLGATPDHLTALIEAGFLLWFDGIAVVKHWRMANSLKSDRLRLPRYPEIAQNLYLKDTKAYTLTPHPDLQTLMENKQMLISDSGIHRESQKRREEKRRIEKSKEEKSREEESRESGEAPEDAAAAEENDLHYLKGSLGKGVVLLSDRQITDLLRRLGIDSFDHYVDKLANYILKNNAHIKNHYQTILKWYEEDQGIAIDN